MALSPREQAIERNKVASGKPSGPKKLSPREQAIAKNEAARELPALTASPVVQGPTGGAPLAGGLLGAMAPFDPFAGVASSVGAPVAAPSGAGSQLVAALGGMPGPAAVAQPADQIGQLRSLASVLFPQMSVPGVDVGAALKPYDEARATAQGQAEGGKAEIGRADQALRERLAALQGQATQMNAGTNQQIGGDLAGLLARSQQANAGLVNDLSKQGASPQAQALGQRAQVQDQGLSDQAALQQTLATRLAQSQANNTASLGQSAELTKTGALGTLQNNLDALLGQIGVKRAGAQNDAQKQNADAARQNAQLAAQRAQGLFGFATDLAKQQGQPGASTPASVIAPYAGRTDKFGAVVNGAIKEIEDGTMTPEEAKAAVNTNQEFKDAGYSSADVGRIIDDYYKAKATSASAVTPDMMAIFKQLLGG